MPRNVNPVFHPSAFVFKLAESPCPRACSLLPPQTMISVPGLPALCEELP